MIDIHGHSFEIFTLVSEIHENINFVLGIKNIFELQVIMNSWKTCFSFLNRSVPFFPKEQVILKQKEQQFIKIVAPFIDEISGLATLKMLDKKAEKIMLKLEFVENLATLDETNSSLQTKRFGPKEMLDILDLRLVGYYKIKQRILQQNLSKCYTFESGDTLCEQFNKFINTLKRRKK